MGQLRYYIVERATGYLRGEVACSHAERTKAEILADVIAHAPAEHEIRDAAVSPCPPEAPTPPNPLVAEYAAASTDVSKLDVIAKSLGLKS